VGQCDSNRLLVALFLDPVIVELRVEQHHEPLGDQLVRLGFDITNDINPKGGLANENPRRHPSASGDDVPEWPGAIRTRDLLLRSAGLTASHR
jgi:hypothetical protein